MNSSAPKIGFDRFVQLDWIRAVVDVSAGARPPDDLNELLNAAALGKEALAKTRTKLNAFGLQPKPELAAFVSEGARLVSDHSEQHALLAFAWGAAIGTYPFFGKLSEFVGRLTSIQGDCSVSELHRRMSEIYGERAVTKRATQAVLQTQTNWGVVKRVEEGKRIKRSIPLSINNERLVAWLIEAVLRYSGKPVSLTSLQSLPVLFPFTLMRPLTYVVSTSPNLSLRSEGPSNQVVALRGAI